MPSKIVKPFVGLDCVALPELTKQLVIPIHSSSACEVMLVVPVSEATTYPSLLIAVRSTQFVIDKPLHSHTIAVFKKASEPYPPVTVIVMVVPALGKTIPYHIDCAPFVTALLQTTFNWLIVDMLGAPTPIPE
jgi:hypothetical protein